VVAARVAGKVAELVWTQHALPRLHRRKPSAPTRLSKREATVLELHAFFPPKRVMDGAYDFEAPTIDGDLPMILCSFADRRF
jgi:hypothetical protein